MNSAKYKRHAKIILKHPIKLSFVPVLIATIVSVYMVSLSILIIGYSAGLKRPVVPNTTNIYPPVENTFPVFNTESADLTEIEEFLQMEQSDEELINEMNQLLYELDGSSSALAYTVDSSYLSDSSNNSVLGVESSNKPYNTPQLYSQKAYPVERKMYDNVSLLKPTPVEQGAGINTIETSVDFMGFTESLRNIIFPILCLALAVLGVNYLEDKTLLTKKHHLKYGKKKVVSKKRS